MQHQPSLSALGAIAAVSLVAPLSFMAAQPAAFKVAPTPSISVESTAADGSVNFGTAAWATRLPDGSIVIADQADGALRIADSSGRVRRSWGRMGDGPGEYRVLSWVSACGADSLYAWDARASRLSVLHPASGYVRQLNTTGANGVFSAACDRRGNVAMFSSIAPRRGATSAVTEQRTADGRTYSVGVVGASIVVRDRAGATVQELRDVSFGEMLMGQLGPGGNVGAMPRPLGAFTAFALLEGQLIVASTDSATVSWYARDGSVQRRTTLPTAPGAPTAAQFDASINRAVEVAPARVRTDLIAFAKQVPRPTLNRAFSQMLNSSNGLLWFVTSLPGDAVTKLRAVNSAGAIAATLDVRAAMEVFEVGSDYVLGRTESADGEQRIVLYRYSR